jgi:Holliday junction resolvasome RuvABC endonuclease subunit
MSGREYVWGVDPAVSRQAFAFAPVYGGPVEVRTLRTDSEAREGQRLGWLDRQLRTAARQWAGEYSPACVWVEQPSGRFTNLPLVYATGVVLAGLFESLDGVPVWTIPSGAWKKRSVGVGNATKEQVASFVEKQRIGFDGQDEADAICIAMAGRAMFKSGRWEAAA